MSEIVLAANGPEAESDLSPMDEAAFREKAGAAPWRWVPPGEPVRVEGAQASGEDIWKYLMLSVLAVLGAEMAILAWPAIFRRASSPVMEAPVVPASPGAGGRP